MSKKKKNKYSTQKSVISLLYFSEYRTPRRAAWSGRSLPEMHVINSIITYMELPFFIHLFVALLFLVDCFVTKIANAIIKYVKVCFFFLLKLFSLFLRRFHIHVCLYAYMLVSFYFSGLQSPFLVLISMMPLYTVNGH